MSSNTKCYYCSTKTIIIPVTVNINNKTACLVCARNNFLVARDYTIQTESFKIYKNRIDCPRYLEYEEYTNIHKCGKFDSDLSLHNHLKSNCDYSPYKITICDCNSKIVNGRCLSNCIRIKKYNNRNRNDVVLYIKSRYLKDYKPINTQIKKYLNEIMVSSLVTQKKFEYVNNIISSYDYYITLIENKYLTKYSCDTIEQVKIYIKNLKITKMVGDDFKNILSLINFRKKQKNVHEMYSTILLNTEVQESFLDHYYKTIIKFKHQNNLDKVLALFSYNVDEIPNDIIRKIYSEFIEN